MACFWVGTTTVARLAPAVFTAQPWLCGTMCWFFFAIFVMCFSLQTYLALGVDLRLFDASEVLIDDLARSIDKVDERDNCK
jgi:hypothetical protein